MKKGTQLHTRDGRKVGNAIVTRRKRHPVLGRLYAIETDFGNTAKLTLRELHELFHVGKRTNLKRWRSDRAKIIGK
ncbi:MAG: hypothetical protein QOE70_5508 [Chthoniobacter sp.]|jgi:hypothetical protein|nr:hypothetical protein [Chthoniobacter sp.]